MLSKSAQTQADSDLERYKLLVQQGVFYEYLADRIAWIKLSNMSLFSIVIIF
jgi:hypothetical protein